MKQYAKGLFSLILLLTFSLTAMGQKQQVRIESFTHDPMDQAAKEHPQRDGNGDLYALIKVRPSAKQFRFTFGYMKSIAGGEHDDETWIYVQRNARKVTVTGEGYEAIRDADLGQTLSAGETYIMQLSFDEVVSIRKHSLSKQMVQFLVEPANSGAMVSVKNTETGQQEVLGAVDATGSVSANLDFGTYTYQVMSALYVPSEGILTVAASAETLVERVRLQSNTGTVVLTTAAGADLYIDNVKCGTGTWQGELKPGEYLVEARRASHVSTSQRITVIRGEKTQATIPSPVPITGFVSVMTNPAGAKILIDGQDVGKSPMNVNDVLIGSHQVTLKAEGYKDYTATVVVKEGEMASVSATMEKGFTPSEGRTFTVKGVSFVMVPVEGGTFQMGATSEQGSDANSDEKPVHSVTLSSYSIGQTEVTQDLWEAVMGSNVGQQRDKRDKKMPLRGEGAKYPMYYISWEECLDFITKLNTLTGEKFRLPTEAEWEYAARGGKQSKGYKYSGSNTLDNVAWYGTEVTHKVATKCPNELGLYDMSGNVREWCQDWFDNYSSSSQTNPAGASSGIHRVLRGGSGYDNARLCRVSSRGGGVPKNSRYLAWGLRLAL
ncbi:MAG: SUMF1/EgtB/PvdO family nonheme iron enzyme [Bacteroidaceae bacterium]|nr:SUMF1/EgtB/PvdO family nonheme iron enzyme [Bacteroidaceae bacterium]